MILREDESKVQDKFQILQEVGTCETSGLMCPSVAAVQTTSVRKKIHSIHTKYIKI